MSEYRGAPDEAKAVFESLHADQREMMIGILGSLSLREDEIQPPLSGGMPRTDLHEEVVANIKDAYGDNSFIHMNFHFVLEKLALAKAVTIYPEGVVRVGNHPGGDPKAITLPGRKPMSTIDLLRTEAYWGISPSCLDRPSARW